MPHGDDFRMGPKSGRTPRDNKVPRYDDYWNDKYVVNGPKKNSIIVIHKKNAVFGVAPQHFNTGPMNGRTRHYYNSKE